MAAANTDKLRKKKSNFSTTITSGISNSDTTIPLNSATGLPTDTAVTLTLDRIDGGGTVKSSALWERVTGVISGTDLTNALRGQDGTSAQSHDSGAVVEDIWDADTWNDMVDWGLAEHTQAGLHSGTRVVYIPATAMWPATTSGCAALAKTELGTNDVDIQTLDFDTSSDEFAQFALQMPGNWNAGTVTFIPHWTAASGSGTVAWALSGRSYANDAALDQATGTAQTSTDTLITANDLHIGPESSAITLAGTPAANEYVHFKIMRDVSADTLGVDAKLLGIQIIYTASSLDVS